MMPAVLPQIKFPSIMSVQEIESACDESALLQFDRNPNELPSPTLEQTFFPLGFPLRVRTNSREVLRQCERKWGIFKQRFHPEPMETHIHVVETESVECPPTPRYWFTENRMTMVADESNFCTSAFPGGNTQMVVTTAALEHPQYFSQLFLDCAPALAIGSRFTTPIHAACVAINGRGIMLCGDSGAGKTSLSYACARSGWQFVADDTAYILHGEATRKVIGNCHHLRFRPSAADLFPEIAGQPITPRAVGKPSIEMLTEPMAEVDATCSAQVDFIVFLNRRNPGFADIYPYRKEVARLYMSQWLFGTPESKAAQRADIERMLTAEVLELRYESLDWAVERLERLAREGR
jgi:hypothetical protein